MNLKLDLILISGFDFLNLAKYHTRQIDLMKHFKKLNSQLSFFFVVVVISRGLSPEEADLQYLKIAASKLVMFGVDAHPARVRDSFYLLF